MNRNIANKYCARIPTPFFIYDFSLIEKRFRSLKGALPSRVSIFYSVKANPTLAILKFIQHLGLGVEVSSAGELSAVKKLGFHPGRIIFTGPGKTDDELEMAVKAGIYLIVVESLAEAERINKIARKFVRNQDILVRLNMALGATDSGYVMSGGSQKFGVDEESANDVVSRITAFKNVNLSGLHFYGASGVLNYQSILNAVNNFFRRIKKIESFLKINFPVIDIGGGFGVNYASAKINNQQENIKQFGRKLMSLFKNYNFDHRKIILEVGRFFVAEAGSYVTRVIDIKESRGKKIVIVDGGMNHLARVGLAGEGHNIEVIGSGRKTERQEKVDIAGPLPTPTDILSRNVRLSRVRLNDLIVINKAGAYGLTAGMLYFSSRPLPAEYALINGKFKLIRRRSEVEKSIFSNQTMPQQLYV